MSKQVSNVIFTVSSQHLSVTTISIACEGLDSKLANILLFIASRCVMIRKAIRLEDPCFSLVKLFSEAEIAKIELAVNSIKYGFLIRRSGVRVTPGAQLRSGARFRRMQRWLVRVFVLLAICSAAPAH